MALWRNALNKISAKVAAYQILASDFGVTFTNRGSTASFTFTLPTVADLPAGWWCEFYGVSATGFVIASAGSSDNIVALNDATADSITMTTTSRIIGANVRVVWDGTSWLTFEGAGPTYVVA
jgi:hypothetical protein